MPTEIEKRMIAEHVAMNVRNGRDPFNDKIEVVGRYIYVNGVNYISNGMYGPQDDTPMVRSWAKDRLKEPVVKINEVYTYADADTNSDFADELVKKYPQMSAKNIKVIE